MNILGKQQSKLNMDVGIVIIQLFLEVSLLKRAYFPEGTLEGLCPHERHTLLSFLALYMGFCDSAWLCRHGFDFNLLQLFSLESL